MGLIIDCITEHLQARTPQDPIEDVYGDRCQKKLVAKGLRGKVIDRFLTKSKIQKNEDNGNTEDETEKNGKSHGLWFFFSGHRVRNFLSLYFTYGICRKQEAIKVRQ